MTWSWNARFTRRRLQFLFGTPTALDGNSALHSDTHVAQLKRIDILILDQVLFCRRENVEMIQTERDTWGSELVLRMNRRMPKEEKVKKLIVLTGIDYP